MFTIYICLLHMSTVSIFIISLIFKSHIMLYLLIISNSCTFDTLSVIATALSTIFSRSTPCFPLLILSKIKRGKDFLSFCTMSYSGK